MQLNERVFVSGAAGVIGKELLLKLGKLKNVEVLAADRKPQPRDLPSNTEYLCGDLNELTLDDLTAFSPTIFIHLAATFERSTESLDFWSDNFENNVSLSHHLMGLMVKVPSLKRVVFASSYLIYDQALYQFNSPQKSPTRLEETSIICPRNLVGMAKLAHEKELEFLADFFSERFTALSVRIFRGYGRGSRDVVSRWIRSLISGEEILVYSPEGIFDFIYAKDSAEGLIKLALESDIGGVINLGSGSSHRIAEILEVLHRHFPNMKMGNQDLEIPYEASEANISKLIDTINWKPEYTLDRAISEMIDYEKSNNTPIGLNKVTNILVTSSSKKAPLIRALQKTAKKIDKEIKIIAGDVNSNVITRYVADQFWEMPILDDSKVELILEKCTAYNIGLIIPTRDGELSFWAKNKSKFKGKGIDVLISDFNSVEICLDKLMFYEFMIENEYNCIETLLELPTSPSKSLFVVKERYGSGSKNIGIGLSYTEAKNFASKLEYPIFQPMVSGKEISADIWIIPGIFESVVLRSRDLIVEGESQVTSIFHDEPAERMFLEIAQKLRIIGPAVFQAIIDGSGKLHLIECNARIGGASTASVAAGSGGFEIIINYFTAGNKEFKPRKTRAIKRITQVRTSVDEHYDDFNF
jgi:carbamoyl-phosphate synthase large subunit